MRKCQVGRILLGKKRPSYCVSNIRNPRCVLCPRDSSAVTTKKRKAADFDILAALKPTEGRRWAHVLCSAWIPEIQYTDTATFKTAEGITTIPRDRWEGVRQASPRSTQLIRAQVCTLCDQRDGAIINCAECAVPFHPSCAWTSGFRFGFEFSLVRGSSSGALLWTRTR